MSVTDQFTYHHTVKIPGELQHLKKYTGFGFYELYYGKQPKIKYEDVLKEKIKFKSARIELTKDGQRFFEKLESAGIYKSKKEIFVTALFYIYELEEGRRVII